MNDLQHRLRYLRTEKKLTLKQTENLSGVSSSYLSAIENGRRGAGRSTLRKLAMVFSDTEKEQRSILNDLLSLPSQVSAPIPLVSAKKPSPKVAQRLPDVVTTRSLANEIQDFVLLLAGADSDSPAFELVGMSDREISEKGRRISRAYLVKVGDEKVEVLISVSRPRSVSSE